MDPFVPPPLVHWEAEYVFVGMGSGRHSLLCMMARTRWFAVPPHSSVRHQWPRGFGFGLPSQAPFGSRPIEPALPHHRGRPSRLKPRAPPPAAPLRRSRLKKDHLLLLRPNFVVNALLVSTLLCPGRRVWGGGLSNSSGTPCSAVLRIKLLLYNLKLFCSSVRL